MILEKLAEASRCRTCGKSTFKIGKISGFLYGRFG